MLNSKLQLLSLFFLTGSEKPFRSRLCLIFLQDILHTKCRMQSVLVVLGWWQKQLVERRVREALALESS